METNGVQVETIRAIDHSIATGVWPDMTEHGWEVEEWPTIFDKAMAADILVLAGPIWLGDNSSVTQQIIEQPGVTVSGIADRLGILHDADGFGGSREATAPASEPSRDTTINRTTFSLASGIQEFWGAEPQRIRDLIRHREQFDHLKDGTAAALCWL
jgi:multimeric flavodoxin WrbA